MGRLTAKEIIKLNNDNPENQLVQLGSKIDSVQKAVSEDDANFQPLLVFTYAITADGSSGLTMLASVPFAMRIMNIHVEATVTSGSGTATVRNGSTAITDAMVMAVDKTIVNAGTIDDAESVLAVADSLTVITAGANDRGVVTIVAKRTD